MANSVLDQKIPIPLRSTALGLLVGMATGLVFSGAVQAGASVSSIQTSEVSATPFTYEVGGIEYRWGMGNNQLMEQFMADGHSFEYALAADRVEIRRDDIVGVTTGEPCGIFVERLADGDASRTFSADYPSDGSGTGNCDIAAMLASRVVNRGAVDLFSNKLPDAKNIERLDYVYDTGVLAPFSAEGMDLAGHVTAEKASNNPVKMAAILKLDILGQPAAYGPMVLVSASGCAAPSICYGQTDLQHTYSFLQNDFNRPQSYPKETERSVETVGMAFVATVDLGLSPGQRYYGFSLFADDVSADQHDLIDPATFPDDTSDDYIVPGDEADIYGGMSGYFLATDLNVTSGAVFLDIDGDGIPDESEAGISEIKITLYEDKNNNGMLDPEIDTPIGDSIDSDMSGNFVLPGIPDGNYLVVMDESDSDIPPGLLVAPGTNPHPLSVAGGDSDSAYFPFISENGNTDGGADGGVDSGTDDGGVPPINDPNTIARDDSYEINQGETDTFDVLENDEDGTGKNLLTLVNDPSSPNATITVVDNKIVYRPNYGFYGTDTFFYVMEDSDGFQDTANVTMEVVRFSDLNGNLLNDYVECGCSDLKLETGVDGSGIGRVSGGASLILLMLIGIRRRSKSGRRQPMANDGAHQ